MATYKFSASGKTPEGNTARMSGEVVLTDDEQKRTEAFLIATNRVRDLVWNQFRFDPTTIKLRLLREKGVHCH